jgi:hypothetical protein
VLEPDEGDRRASIATLGAVVELVKLSDDPNWPDITQRPADLELFAD